MFRSSKQSLTSLCSLLVGLTLVLGLSASALGQAPPPAGPVEDIQGTLGIILDRLDDIDDALPESLGPCEVPPVWGKKIAGAARFVAVLDGAAYCDQETGLVWEESPAITGGPNNDGNRNWFDAIRHCAQREVDDRKGWALPMREQLATLVDTQSALCTTGGGPCLPDGHPFSNVPSALYWSASAFADFPAIAWFVNFSNGDVSAGFVKDFDGGLRPWCVRGGQSFDGNTHDTLH